MNRTHKIFFPALVASFSLVTPGTIHAEQKDNSKPNILFIAVDDLKPTLGCYDDKMAITPNIDKLTERGTLMMNNYCQQAVCAPSRVSLFTGLRPDKTKVRDLKTNMRDMNPDILTMPEFFKQNGYETVGLGKLIHGAKNNDPQSWSIPYKEDRELTYAKGYEYPANGKYQAKEAHKAYAEASAKKLGWKATNKYLKGKGVAPATECLKLPDAAYEDGAIAREGKKLLNRLSKKNKPFFLALGFHKPHLPFVAPKRYWDLYDRDKIKVDPHQEMAKNSPEYAYSSWGELRNYSDIPSKGGLTDEKQQELIHGYYACVSYVDAQIGLVMDKLDELGLADNTIIVLWGDHGWHLGDHGLWCKHTNFEQATKAPLFFAAPGFTGKQKTQSMTEFVDVFPTLCELSGLDTPSELGGKSLVPILKNSKAEVKEYAISQYPRHNNLMGYTLRTERYRLTLWMKDNFDSTKEYDPALINDIELYDYRKDPRETTSYADHPEYRKVKKELMGMMVEYFEEQR